MTHIENTDDFLMEIEKEKKQIEITEKIYNLYINVIEKYLNGDYELFNPNTAAKISFAKFYDWVLKNNPNISSLFIN